MTTDPTARETSATELAEAETLLAHVYEYGDAGTPAGQVFDALGPILAEYNRCGTENEELRDRDRLLRHYLGKITNRLGRPTRSTLRQEGEIEEVGEGVLAELERLRVLAESIETVTSHNNALIRTNDQLRARVAELEPIEQRARNLVAINEPTTSRVARVILGES